jgi:hypothetical protein
MLIRVRIILTAFFLVFLLAPQNSYSQEIDVRLNAIDPLDSDAENIVLDVNGEVCSLVILSTDLADLKFYSNLGVERIEKKENGYRIWIPNQASVIRIFVPGYPLFEYNLPRSEYTYSVYIISLIAEKPGENIHEDGTQPRLSLVSNPEKSTVLLNGTVVGRTPLVLVNPGVETFDYRIRKRGYRSFSGTDSMDLKMKNISVELEDLRRSKRYFVVFNIKWDGISRSQVDAHGMKGITFGVFGKTGYYGSVNYVSVNDSLDLTSTNDEYPEYYNYNQGQKVSLVGGISYQLGKSVFIYGGPGYVRRTYQREGYPDGRSQSLILNTGVIIRIGWYSVLQIDFSPGFNNSYTSFGFGLGINLPNAGLQTNRNRTDKKVRETF